MRSRHMSGAGWRRAPRLLSGVLAAVLAVTACSGDEEAPQPSPDDDGGGGSKPTAVWPFTGLPAPGALPAHRAALVKIDNSTSSDPQVGLAAAALVVEELVEGGLTRLAAFYYSTLPKEVGPVRSMRATDIGIVASTGAALVASGAAPQTEARVRQARIETVKEGGPGYHRAGDRAAPYNLFMDLRQLGKAPVMKGKRPAPYLPWGKAKKLTGGKPAKQISVQFSGGSVTEWKWGGGSWRRATGYAAEGDDFTPANVLALRVQVTDAGYLDPAGNPVPESVFAGKGPATLFTGGKAYKGTWRKSGPDGRLSLRSAKGRPMPVPAGKTWIELVPKSGGDVRYSR
ncbi:MAG: DUF3048 domain-containing protein [Propionibacteriales bacterium]|nr:DUF3048 domain-containing protein [Propionibacteriales bacterium]